MGILTIGLVLIGFLFYLAAVFDKDMRPLSLKIFVFVIATLFIIGSFFSYQEDIYGKTISGTPNIGTYEIISANSDLGIYTIIVTSLAGYKITKTYRIGSGDAVKIHKDILSSDPNANKLVISTDSLGGKIINVYLAKDGFTKNLVAPKDVAPKAAQ